MFKNRPELGGFFILSVGIESSRFYRPKYAGGPGILGTLQI